MSQEKLGGRIAYFEKRASLVDMFVNWLSVIRRLLFYLFINFISSLFEYFDSKNQYQKSLFSPNAGNTDRKNS